MLKKFIFAISFIFLYGSAVYAAPILSVGDYVALPGDVFRVDVMLSNTSDQDLGKEFDFFGFRLNISPADFSPTNGVTFTEPLNYNIGDAINVDNQGSFLMTRNSGTLATATHAVFSGTAYPFTDGLICSVELLANELGVYDLSFVDVEFGHLFTPYPIEVQNGSVNVNAIPIPSTLLLLGTGLMGLMGLRRRK